MGFETRGWDEDRQITTPQRTKEEAHDYRYFPEPDIPPMSFTKADVENFRKQIPELPDIKINRFIKEYELSQYDAGILCESRETADYYEDCLKVARFKGLKEITPKTVANWIINKREDYTKLSPEEFLKILLQKTAIAVLNNDDLQKIIRKIIENNPKAVSDYKAGKEQVLMFLVGQVMRETKGKGDINFIKEKLRKLID